LAKLNRVNPSFDGSGEHIEFCRPDESLTTVGDSSERFRIARHVGAPPTTWTGDAADSDVLDPHR
jgi:hypothetical protein